MTQSELLGHSTGTFDLRSVAKWRWQLALCIDRSWTGRTHSLPNSDDFEWVAMAVETSLLLSN